MEVNTCRVCLNNSSDVCRSLFEKHGPDKMSIMLKHVTGIEILINSQLPNKICNVCWKDAITAYDLKNRFIQSHNELKILLQKSDPFFNETNMKVEPQENELQIIKTEHVEIDFQNLNYEDEPVVVDNICNVESIELVNIQIKEAKSKSQFECVKCVQVIRNKFPTTAYQMFRKHMHQHNREKIICLQCDPHIQFAQQIHLEHHEFILHNIGDKNPLNCKDCNFVFEIDDKNFWNSYRAHVKSHNRANFFGCDLCFPRTFHHSEIRLQYHKFSIHQIGIICKKTFNNVIKLERLGDAGSKCKAIPLEIPRTTRNSGKIYKCYICNKIFAMLVTKIEHINKEHADKVNVDCHLCVRKKLSSATVYEKHLSTHLSEYQYICSYCGRGFHDSQTLRRHINGFHETNYLFCDVCGAKNKSKPALQKHMQTIHLKMRNFKCNKCLCDFTSSEMLRRHQFKFHDGEPRYKCNKCLAGYICRNEYNRHFLVCSPEGYIPEERSGNSNSPIPLCINGRIICPECGKDYLNQKSWMSHYHSFHVYEKTSYECEICHKVSNKLGNHKKHMLIHAEVKPHVCDICNKRFAQKTGMQTHRRVHTGEKPYSCTICSKAFSDISTRIKHMKIIHKIVKYH